MRSHGHTRNRSFTPEYCTWASMIDRCHRPGNKQFHNYGGRGISVFDRWRGRGGFIEFLAHMGPRPSPKHSLDRINNDGNYEPGNVRWATQAEQASNTRVARIIEFKGRSMTLSAWAREIGISAATLHERLARWPVEIALERELPAAPLRTKEEKRAIHREWKRRRRLAAKAASSLTK